MIRPFAARLAAVELPVLTLLVIGSIAVERLLPVALVVATFFWLVRWLAYGRPTVRTPGDWPIGLLAIMVPVTLWATAQPEITRAEVLRLLTGLALYYAVANWAGSIARCSLLPRDSPPPAWRWRSWRRSWMGCLPPAGSSLRR